MSLDSSSNSAPVRFWVGDFLWKINLNENKSIYNIKLWFDLRHVLQDKCVCVCVCVCVSYWGMSYSLQSHEL